MTGQKRDILRHALGLDYKDKPWRNFFATAPDCDCWADIVELEKEGLMVRGHVEALGGLVYFHVTEAGRKAMLP